MTAIKTENLSKIYGTVNAVTALNMEVPDNVVFGFLGPNGAGKTTTVRLLTGFSQPTSGSAWVAGEKVADGNLRLQEKTGLLPDVPAFYNWMTGREFLQMVGELHRLSPGENKKRTDELLEIAGLKQAAKRSIGGYSRGMRQRLGIAQALVNRPQVLFMDEPTSALDPIGRKEILALVRQLRQTATIFMSTHILSDVERVCDLVGIIDKGKLLTISTVEALQKKYARSIFEMEFAEDATSFLEVLKKVSWLTEPKMNTGNGAPYISARAIDATIAGKELPRMASESGLTLRRYELTQPDLEEIFVKILNGGGK
jgi:ABC-2 type transport system ATP-binding protein